MIRLRQVIVFIILMIFTGIAMATDGHNFSFTNLDGSEYKLSDLKGKVVLIVNTASHCVFTKQYAQMEELWQQYKDKGLVVIAIPSNDFGDEEPLSNEEVKDFCETHYSTTFPIMKKEKTRGNEAHPFYLYAKEKFGIFGAPKWNFHKFLLNKDGEVVEFYHSLTTPTSNAVKNRVEELLAQ